MSGLVLAAQSLDLATWLALVGPDREGNPLMAALPVLTVVAVKITAVTFVIAVSRWRHLRLPLLAAGWMGVIGAVSNVLAVQW